MNIKEEVAKINQKIKVHKAKGKILLAKLRAVQELCEHKDADTWTHYDYGGGSDNYFECKDCGLKLCNILPEGWIKK